MFGEIKHCENILRQVCAKRSQNEGESDWDFLVRWRKWNKNTIYEMEDEIETHKTEMKESPQS